MMARRLVFPTASLAALVAAVLAHLPCAVAAADGAGHRAVTKIAVFPMLYQGERGAKMDEATAKSLDETWWQIREELTGTGRFVVAGRAFLQKADAFQPRGQLSPADAVILSRYVEADAVMTVWLKERTLTISAWDATDGGVLWDQVVELHPSVLIREQLVMVARRLVKEFIAAIPYQGITLQDELARTAVFEDGSKKKVRVRVGKSEGFAVGDSADWLRLTRTNLEALFQGGAKAEIVASGRIVAVEGENLVVELDRRSARDAADAIKSGSLVVFPRQAARLKAQAGGKDITSSAAVAAVLAKGDPEREATLEPEGVDSERRRSDTGPMATVLSIIASLAAVLLLAF